MNFPFPVPFTVQTLQDWIALERPLTIFMTDKQYAHPANLLGANPREIKGIPIRFLDAPARV